MATAYFVGNANTLAQIVTATVTAVANAATLVATINSKAVTYTCTGSDTTSTAAAAWAQLLQASLAAEFQEVVWSANGNVLTATSGTPGQPFTVVFSAAGGAAVTQAPVQANVSPSDVGDPNNWLRGGSFALPQNGDDVVFQNCSIPALWNADALAAVRPLTITRYQSQTGQIGLPTINPAGYLEYRPTYLQFSGPNGSTLYVVLGDGNGVNNGPPAEYWQFNDTGQLDSITVLNGQNVHLNPKISNLTLYANVNVHNSTVVISVQDGESTQIQTLNADGNSSVTIGAGVGFTVTGSINLNSATLTYYSTSAPSALSCLNGSNVTVYVTGVVFPSVTTSDGSSLTWVTNATITSLTMERNCNLDASLDWRGMAITGGTIDGTCQINDPLNRITYTNPITVSSPVTSGPFLMGSGRTLKIV